MLHRDIESGLQSKLFKGKAIIIVGPRQVGKTTLLKTLFSKRENTVFWNCDEPDIREMLARPTSTELNAMIGKSDIVCIDEAQRVKNIGVTLKLLTDTFPEKQIIVTGSSALQLSNSINEPLTGRKYEYTLLPFSVNELITENNALSEKRMLENRLIYGSYPEVINNPGEEQSILQALASSYLYKDIFSFQDVRKPDLIERLLQALALQVGSEVSFNELSQLLAVDAGTIRRYVDLLEKTYVIFHYHSLSRNARNELKKGIKIYFFDNGIRNTIISDFKPVALRSDVGKLWENYLMSERLKYNVYNNKHVLPYFWRTMQQQEIDYIEEKDGTLHAYEYKWNEKRIPKLSLTFANAYPNHTFTIINTANYQQFLLGEL